MIESHQDAYGHIIYDLYKGLPAYEIYERDDGFVEITNGPEIYFQDFKDWSSPEKSAMDYVIGRVLDIGCGGGRNLVYLQQKGFDVTGIDDSPLTIRVCRKRGIKKAKNLSIVKISRKLGIFDTIIMFGGTFGLLGNPRRARWLLKKMYGLTSAKGRIIATTTDPYMIKSREHVEYTRQNIRKGHMGGRLRFRIRYKKYISGWYEWLTVSKDEMRSLLEGTGWMVQKYISSAKSPFYIGMIFKE